MSNTEKPRLILIDQEMGLGAAIAKILSDHPDLDVQVMTEDEVLEEACLRSRDESHGVRADLLDMLLEPTKNADFMIPMKRMPHPDDKRPGHLKGLGGHISGMQRTRR